MIYTTREMINGRSGRKRPNPRPAGENAERGDLWNGAELGMKWAANGHNMPYFDAAAEGVARRKRPLFSENSALRPRSRCAIRAAI